MLTSAFRHLCSQNGSSNGVSMTCFPLFPPGLPFSAHTTYSNCVASARFLVTALVVGTAFIAPANAAVLQLECTSKTKMVKAQSDGSMFRKDVETFSLDTESRTGSITDREGSIYDLNVRFTADKIFAFQKKYLLNSSPDSSYTICRYDISRTNGSLQKSWKFVVPITGQTPESVDWNQMSGGGSCKKKAVQTML